MYYTGQGKDNSKEPLTSFPGIDYFYKATNVLNLALGDLQFSNCTIEAVETLLLYAFYHQLVDGSDGHYVTSGLAMRTALIMGMHKKGGDELSRFDQEHSRRLWWTLYGIDRYCSAKSGFPISIPDESITTELPADISESVVRDEVHKYDQFVDSCYITCYVELERIFSSMLSRLYQPKSHGDIIPVMLSVLSDVHAWQQGLPNVLKVDYTKEPLKISRIITNIHSEYFRCINLTIRPLLLYFVRKRLRSRRTKRAPIDLSIYSPDIIALLNASLQASIQTLRSHRYLLDLQQLAKFGYLDREYIYSAISTLVLFNVAFGVHGSASQQINVGLDLLSEMERVGNSNARKRKKQTEHLIRTFEINGIPTHIKSMGSSRSSSSVSGPGSSERLPSISGQLLNSNTASVQLAEFAGSTNSGSSNSAMGKQSPSPDPAVKQLAPEPLQQLPPISRLHQQSYDSLTQYGNLALPPPSPQAAAIINSGWSPSPVSEAAKDKTTKDTLTGIASPLPSSASASILASNSPERYTQNFMLLDQNGPDMFDHGVLSSLSSFGLTSDALGLPVNLFGSESSQTYIATTTAGHGFESTPTPSTPSSHHTATSSSSGNGPTGGLHAYTTDAPPATTSYELPHTTTQPPLPAHHATGQFSLEQEENLWQEVTSQGLLWLGTVPDEYRSVLW